MSVKERPILFSAPMVRAILAGTNTQTRRIAKIDGFAYGKPYREVSVGPATTGLQDVACPYGQPGDRLWVRETWQGPLMSSEEFEAHGNDDSGSLPARFNSPSYCQYAADGGPAPEFMTADDEWVCRWRPSIYMPRWASRITLEITAVRVERLQDISEADAIAEGVDRFPGCRQDDDAAAFNRIGPVDNDSFPIARYAVLWESINGHGSWDANPWVWVVEFKRAET